MPTHTALQVRNAVALRLQSLPSTGENVYEGRGPGHNYKDSEYPCLNVTYAEDLQVEDESSPEDVKTSDLMVHIEIRAKVGAHEDLDGELLGIRGEVELALESAVTLGGKIPFLEVEGFERELADEKKRVGLGRLYVRCRYQRWVGDPYTLLEEAS